MKFYKLGYFFLSKVNNITESLEKGLDKVVSRGEKNFSVHRKYMNFLRPRKTALDEPLYKLSAGRSMVEMLGVLAIIGVLSVGAIAGYSKAMNKYKLNKQTEQITQILSGMIEYKNLFSEIDANSGETFLLPYYKKLNIIPQEMVKDNSNYLYDAFNNKVLLYVSGNIAVRFYDSDMDSCINHFNLAKGFADELLAIGYAGKDTEDEHQEHWFWGNKNVGCYNDKRCISTLDVNTIGSICNECISGNSCQVYYVFPSS